MKRKLKDLSLNQVKKILEKEKEREKRLQSIAVELSQVLSSYNMSLEEFIFRFQNQTKKVRAIEAEIIVKEI